MKTESKTRRCYFKMSNTKRALLTSTVAFIVCFAMLIGTTFAWFTDTASTAVNKIQAGNLNIGLEMFDDTAQKWVSAENEILTFKTADNRTADKIFWEPGCTYALPKLRVVNNGSLAIKYKIQITGIAGDAKLNRVIDWTINDAAIDLTERHLLAGESDEFILKGHMWETAGNEYMKETIDGIGITVYAAQYAYEKDSFDEKYDENAPYKIPATYTVSSYDDMKNAFNEGANIILNGYVEGDATKTGTEDRLTITSPTKMELDGTYYVPGSLENSSNWAAFYINADTVINAGNGGGVACLNKITGSYLGGPYVAHINNEKATVTVNGGSYAGGGTTFNVEKGTLIINGGFFHVWPDIDTNDYRYTVNCIDANYKNGTAKIIVKGGTFVNFDPSNNLAEGENTNFVADGYKVVSEEKSDGIYYTVVKE